MIDRVKEDLHVHGFLCTLQQSVVMERMHRHNEIELNYLQQGSLDYLFGGEIIRLPLRRLVIFWASKPHRILSSEPDTFHLHLTVPTAWFLHWNLPQQFTYAVMQGGLVVEANPDREEHDHSLLSQWLVDLNSESSEIQRAVLLEIEARLRRLALSNTQLAALPHEAKAKSISHFSPGFDKVTQMTDYIAEHYHEPITIEDIAQAVGLHPNYAMTLFKETLGVSLLNYITDHRITYAQLLLSTTDKKVLTIAYESGFGSPSNFYATFSRYCNLTPQKFRSSMRLNRSPIGMHDRSQLLPINKRVRG